MLEFIACIVFVWLMVKAFGLTFKLTWGVTKLAVSILMGIAVPLLIVCLLFVGGIALIVPVAVIVIAVGILKTCVS